MGNNGRAGKILTAWRGDYAFQTLSGAAVSLGCTALFALYHGYLGLWFGSIWHGGIGVFYVLLAAIRGSILLSERRNRTRPEKQRSRCRRRTFLVSSALLLALDLALMLPISLMAMLKKPVSVGTIPSITMAAYTTWKITMASAHICRQRKSAGGNLLVAELRTVNFIDALVSILTLQNTLIMVNRSGPGDNSMLPVAAVSSAAIYLAIVAITVRMLWKGLNRTREA